MKKFYFTIIVLLSMFTFDLHAEADDVKEPAPSGIVLTQERKGGTQQYRHSDPELFA